MDNLYIAVVCSSNMNRSMEAHAFLNRKGFKVQSYGTGENIKLPGVSACSPNCYEFGTTYEEIYNDLSNKNEAYYRHTGVLHMLSRNRRIKSGPEKFQTSLERFDVIITCAKIVYAQVIEWFESKRPIYFKPVHIINIEMIDDYEDAMLGSFVVRDLVTEMALSRDLESDISQLVEDSKSKSNRIILNCKMYY